jgi:hypothetical protein
MRVLLKILAIIVTNFKHIIMKKTLVIGSLLASFFFSSCAYRRIGDLTMVATRNVDSKTDYVELRRSVQATYKLRKRDALEAVIDRAVKEVPGGEFIKNAIISIKGDRKVKVEGDVWGVAGKEVQLKEGQQKRLDKQKRNAEFEKQKEEISR